MAKKSTSGHHKPMPAHGKGTARKPQAPERAGTATLVRSPAVSGPSASNVVAEPTPVSEPVAKAAPAPKPAERKTAVAQRPAAVKAPAPKATPAKAAPAQAPAASATASRASTVSSREQNVRLARARATARARQANLISAESYSYVLGDLKLVVGLAISAFVVLIALTFVLPH